MALPYLIKEVVVEASNKSWGQGTMVKGESGGTTFTWSVIPEKEKLGWSEHEALLVSMQVRRKLQALIISDSRIRGVDDPDKEDPTLESYDFAIKMLIENSPQISV